MSGPDMMCMLCGLAYFTGNGHRCPHPAARNGVVPVKSLDTDAAIKQLKQLVHDTAAEVTLAQRQRDQYKKLADELGAKLQAHADGTALLNTAFRFIAGLQLGDHPIALQKEHRELVHRLAKELRPDSPDERRARTDPARYAWSSIQINGGVTIPRGIIKSISYTST